MALVKKTNPTDKIEIVGEYKHIQLRQAEWVEDDATGEKIGSPQYSRRVISPNDDISGESAEVQAVCAAVHTDDVVAAYAAHMEAQANG